MYLIKKIRRKVTKQSIKKKGDEISSVGDGTDDNEDEDRTDGSNRIITGVCAPGHGKVKVQ